MKAFEIGGKKAYRHSAPAEQHVFASQLQRTLSGEISASIHFQPIVSLEQSAVTGYEALARFPPVLAAGPESCFRQAETLGLRNALEDFTFRQSLDARTRLPANTFLSINVSPGFLLSHEWERLYCEVSDLSGLVLEITEEASIVDYKPVRKMLDRVRASGGLIAVDDAGAGFASLAHILEIRPEFIKLDRHFVQGCNLDRAKSTLIEMMGAAANRLDAWIVAEGVETQGELEELHLLGVPLAQGYLLGRPVAQMNSLDPAIRQVLRSRQAGCGEGTLLEGLLMAVSCSANLEAALQTLKEKPEHTAAVVTDCWARPVRLLQRHPLLGIRQIPNFMRVQLGSDPGEVLHRALSREPGCRYDPVVVIKPEGDLAGIVELDRLMRPLMGSVFAAQSGPLQ